MAIRYLLVTHIPFTRNAEGHPVVDSLWARDLVGLSKSFGSIRVVAPELPSNRTLDTWGPNSEAISDSSAISFRGFPVMKSARSFLTQMKVKRVLREEVEKSDLVHTSNFFPPYTCLAHAHDLGVRLKKKTLFVIAEDFYDMLAWEWVRPTQGINRWRRERALNSLDKRARKSAGSATLTLLHTPAAVERFRLSAGPSIMIRQPGHEKTQVIGEPVLEARLSSLGTGRPLHLTTACRHSALKGLDFLIRAIGLLKDRGVVVKATMYGSGPGTGQLKHLAGTLGVADRVSLPGSLAAGPELDGALQKSDFFVMPHRTTDFGRAFFDAMAAGLPVLAFRTPASATTVYDGIDGFLTQLDDAQGLAERIEHLDRDRECLSQLARGARRRALVNTRTEWFNMRTAWILSLFEKDA